MGKTRWLTRKEEAAWRAYRRMRARLDLQLTRDLAAESGLSEPDYDVLSAVSEAAGRRVRLKELAASMLWSPSRLSHHVARMEQRGLVEREEDPSDGRGAMIVLTRDGRRAIETAAPGHVASVRRHLIDLLTPQEIETLGVIARKVVDHLADLEGEVPGAGPSSASASPSARSPRRR